MLMVRDSHCTCSKDARLPKTDGDRNPRNTSRVSTQKGFQKYVKIKSLFITHRHPTLEEQLLMQQVLKQEILMHVRYLTFDDEGVMVGLHDKFK